MSKYIQMEGFRKAILDLNRKEFLEKGTAEHILKLIVDMPTIDIVHCGECKKAHLTYDGDCKYCEEWKDDDGNYIEVYHDSDHFCSDGERIDNE